MIEFKKVLHITKTHSPSAIGPLLRLLVVLVAAMVSLVLFTTLPAPQTAKSSAQSYSADEVRTGEDTDIHPFHVNVPQAALFATPGLAFHIAPAQQVGARRIDLQRHDLSVTGREVVQTIVELAPGTTAPRHTHPGEEVIYVLEGTWEYTVEGKPPVTLKAGDVLFIPAGTIHSARNVGSGKGAELATYIVEKGKPLVVPVK